jgi:putative oxidoreductase
MKYVVLLGRILFSLIFLKTYSAHFSSTGIGYASSAGVPLASIAVPLSGVIAILGGLMIALGFKAKLGAWLIVIFLVPVTLYLHNYWAMSDQMMAMSNAVNFWKNVSMLGAALIITYFGSGPLSLDSLSKKGKKE